MGIYDRDYCRQPLPRGGFGHFSALSVTTWLIVVNVAVFFADGVLNRPAPHRPRHLSAEVDDGADGGSESATPEDYRRAWLNAVLGHMGPLQRWGYFSTDTALRHGQVWRFLTFQFLHASVGHLVGNMVGLFFFGPIVEAHFGSRRYLAFYLGCGLAGAVSYLLLAAAHVLVTDPATPMVGASAGVFGLLVAAALISPHVEVFYYFIPVTIGMLAVAGMLMAAYTVFALGPNAGGEAGHLGGGALGFLLMKNQHWLNPFTPARRPVARPGAARAPVRRRRAKPFQKDWSKDFNR